MKENIAVLNFKADEPTANYRIYPTEVLLKALADKKEIFVENHINSDMDIDIKNIIGSTTFEIKEDNSISGPFKKFDTPAWENLKDIPFENIGFTVKGIGTVDENKIITEFKLISICTFLKDQENEIK